MCSEITNRPCPWDGAVAKGFQRAVADAEEVGSTDRGMGAKRGDTLSA
jgi:hypothetical protein